MNIESHDLHHGDHFLRQLLFEQGNHNRIAGQDDVAYFVFADNLSQPFHDLFSVLLVRVPYTTLVARLRPSTDLDSMNFLASHLLSADHLVHPADEDTRLE